MSADLDECLWLQLKIKETKVMFGAVYRKGRSSVTNNKLLNEVIHKVSNMYEKVLICGDFNLPEINWETFNVDAGPYSAPSQFLGCVNNCYLTQHVSDFTRKRGNNKPSLLDLVITENSQTLFDEIAHEDPLGKSDHCVLKWKYLVSVDDPNTTSEEKAPPHLNVNKGDYKELNQLIYKIDWNSAFKNKDVSDSLAKLYEIVNEKIEICVPYKKAKPRRERPPWMDKAAQKQIKKKSCAWARYQRSKNYAKYQAYIKARNKANKDLRQAKKRFEEDIAANCKSNPKGFHRYANFKSKAQKSVIRLKNEEGLLSMKDEENATLLNKFFTSVFTDEDDSPELILNAGSKFLWGKQSDDPFEYIGLLSKEFIEEAEVTEELVAKLLAKINPNKSNIKACIHPRILKECATSLAGPVSQIFKKSLETATLPSQWTKGDITALHKGGSRHDAKQYRPITITSVLCRTLETVVKVSITEHLDRQVQVNDKQHGFRAKRSCLTNLLLNLEEITSLIDDGNSVDQIYLDFQKAFDKVPHQKLLFKLEKAGISGGLLTWIESFLSKRTQRVKVNGKYSGWRRVKSGVPQGSVLGPLLFILFINDLPDIVKFASPYVFADDTKLSGKANTQEDADKIQGDLNALEGWSITWQLKFNASKCHVLHFGRKNKKYSYQLCNLTLETVTEEKDLGVIISEDLKAEKTVVKNVKKADKILGMIRRTFSFMNKDMLQQLIKVFIRPHLEYAQQAWSPYLRKDINLLESVQRRATKLLGTIAHETYEDRLKFLNLYSIEDRLRRGDMILMFRIMTEDLDIRREDLFPNIKLTSTLRGHHLKVNYSKLANCDVRRNFFSQRVIGPWNELPSNVVECDSVDSFKMNYDKWCGKVSC